MIFHFKTFFTCIFITFVKILIQKATANITQCFVELHLTQNYYVIIFSIIISINVKMKECIYHPADRSLHNANSLQISCAENSCIYVTEILRNLSQSYCLVTSGNRD